ncbi:MAG: hypothetical protein M3680_21770 [Myxococcota bacterium]|nr:hypothetical protein [Myxococcota bacterium]
MLADQGGHAWRGAGVDPVATLAGDVHGLGTQPDAGVLAQLRPADHGVTERESEPHDLAIGQRFRFVERDAVRSDLREHRLRPDALSAQLAQLVGARIQLVGVAEKREWRETWHVIAEPLVEHLSPGRVRELLDRDDKRPLARLQLTSAPQQPAQVVIEHDASAVGGQAGAGSTGHLGSIIIIVVIVGHGTSTKPAGGSRSSCGGLL